MNKTEMLARIEKFYRHLDGRMLDMIDEEIAYTTDFTERDALVFARAVANAFATALDALPTAVGQAMATPDKALRD